VLAATLLIIVGIVMSPRGYGDRLMTLARFAEEPVRVSKRADRDNISDRILTYQAALYALVTHPVLGVGLDRYRDWVPSYDPRMKTHLVLHSSVLSVACQQGFLGLIPYLAILVLTYRDFSRAQRLAHAHRGSGDPELQALHLRAVMAQLGYVGFLIPSLFQPGTFWRGMWIMFAFSTIILSLTQKRVNELASESSSQPADDESTPPQGLLPGRGGGFNGARLGI
jgi:O-antigen ligase